MSAMKLCAFCGGDELGHGYDYPPGRGVAQCYTCDAFVTADTEAEALDRWNRRPEPASPSTAGVEPLAWLKPDWQNPETFDGTSPVTTYRVAGWTPLVPAASLDQATRRAEELKTERDELLDKLDDRIRMHHATEAEADEATSNYNRVWNQRDAQRRRAEATEARVSALEQALEDLRRAGNEMANICCNLKQRTSGLLITEERLEMADSHREWDEAIARARETLSPASSITSKKETDRGN